MIAVPDAGFICSVRSLEFALDQSKLICRGKFSCHSQSTGHRTKESSLSARSLIQMELC